MRDRGFLDRDGSPGYVPVATAIEHAAKNVERALALDDASSSVFVSLGGLNVLRSICWERTTYHGRT